MDNTNNHDGPESSGLVPLPDDADQDVGIAMMEYPLDNDDVIPNPHPHTDATTATHRRASDTLEPPAVPKVDEVPVASDTAAGSANAPTEADDSDAEPLPALPKDGDDMGGIGSDAGDDRGVETLAPRPPTLPTPESDGTNAEPPVEPSKETVSAVTEGAAEDKTDFYPPHATSSTDRVNSGSEPEPARAPSDPLVDDLADPLVDPIPSTVPSTTNANDTAQLGTENIDDDDDYAVPPASPPRRSSVPSSPVDQPNPNPNPNKMVDGDGYEIPLGATTSRSSQSSQYATRAPSGMSESSSSTSSNPPRTSRHVGTGAGAGAAAYTSEPDTMEWRTDPRGVEDLYDTHRDPTQPQRATRHRSSSHAAAVSRSQSQSRASRNDDADKAPGNEGGFGVNMVAKPTERRPPHGRGRGRGGGGSQQRPRSSTQQSSSAAAPGNEGGFGLNMVPQASLRQSSRGRGRGRGSTRTSHSHASGPARSVSSSHHAHAPDRAINASTTSTAPGHEGGFGNGMILINTAAAPAPAPRNKSNNSSDFEVRVERHGSVGSLADFATGAVPIVRQERPAPSSSKGKQRRSQSSAAASPAARGGGTHRSMGDTLGMWFGLNDPYGGIYDTTDTAPANGLAEGAEAPVRFVTDKDEAMREYKAFIQREKQWRREHQNTFSSRNEPMYATSTIKNCPSHESMLRQELLSLPEFKPIFINAVTIIQTLVFLAMVIQSVMQGEFAKWGVNAQGTTCTDNCPLSANASAVTGAVQIEPVNPWLGPTSDYLISFYGKFTPCMRSDLEIQRSLTGEANRECCVNCDVSAPTSPYQVSCEEPVVTDAESGRTVPAGYSCCAMPSTRITAGTTNNPQELCESFFPSSGLFNGTAMVTTSSGRECLPLSLLYGMTSYLDCESYNGVWMRSLTTNIPCSETTRITLRPCCIGHKSECQLLTESQCEFEAGLWHEDKLLCSQVPCLKETCGASTTGKDKPTQNEIEPPNQWYRFITPLLTHSGVIQFAVVAYIQNHIGVPIERSIGWLRIGLVYFVSGIGGYTLSATLDPYEVSCGANPSVFGLIGLMAVELMQTWSVVPNRCWHLTKLLVLIVVGFLVGSLPYIDNFAQLGGFVFGAISSVVFLPYVTLGTWHRRARLFLLVVCVPLLLFMFVAVFVIFYSVQVANCTWCSSFNCYEWHSEVSCDT
eukprot:m.168020 g.168020  ORF g.168020 m.168020 type:complete len:1180 (+) comp12910_c0_seq1:289-3828(+)